MAIEFRSFQSADADAVIALWQACGLTRPWNDPHRDIERKLTVQPELFVVGCLDETIVCSAMAGFDGHRGWINYLAVDPDRQRQGLAALIVRAAEELLVERGCPKINLQIRTSNLDAVRFYEAIGYSMDEVVSMGRRLVDDDPSGDDGRVVPGQR